MAERLPDRLTKRFLSLEDMKQVCVILRFYVVLGPFVRSSYWAEDFFKEEAQI